MTIHEILVKAALTLIDGADSRVVVFIDSPPAGVKETLSSLGITAVFLGPDFEVGSGIIRLPVPRNLDLESSLNLVSAFLIEHEILVEGENFVYVTPTSVGLKSAVRDAFTVGEFFSQRGRVIQRLLEISIELSVEGREGYPVGTIFVVGDVKNVLRHSHSMLPNPFRGHRINVLDDNSREVIKEFAQLDGAFIISSTGRINSAGVYLDVDPKSLDLKLPPGLGSRHIAAAGITKLTEAVSISLSESGTIRIFKNGKSLLEYNPRLRC
ncbi:diadenylate cyclase [Thermococcus sp. Bubb.Bath]|uniref:DNA integrity scanning protein DisA nucleotide-binding domain protein n=1 Tax=Thermococcus sp. Bubb.Bath TaxID=1638242 RepID=UPI0014388B1B|nr:diadenylate cyclase [Thermococcus sp. Bubb.Bath]NJF25964.1 diadenylate cyclase [Thermococcus sp. Bubb.Bath]